MKDRKVFLLGLDGACFDFIDPLMKAGKLPTFKKLIGEGVRANLRSTIPPTTIPAWVAIFTGFNQGKLGCFGQELWERSSGKLEPVSMLSWKGMLLWDVASETRRVGVFRVPRLPRSYPTNGFMITDIYSWSGSPEENVYPPSLFEELQSYWITRETESPLPNAMRMKLALKNFGERIRVAKYLLEHKEMSLFVMITRIPDLVTHLTTSVRKIQLAYEVIDRGLEEIVSCTREKNYDLMLVSDHGTGRKVNRKFCVNSWLQHKAYLSLNSRSYATRALLAERMTELLASKIGSPFLRSVRLIVQSFSGKGKQGSDSSSDWEDQIRWEDTKAFSYGGGGSNYAGIQINRRDSFPHGTVSAEEYEILRNEISRELKRLRDPENGRQIVDQIFLREQMFEGQNIDSIPDIIMKTCVDYKVSPGIGPSILSSDKDTIHTENGIFIASGSAFKKGLEMQEVDTTDIAPTVLYILDVGVPRSMDGRVLKSMFSSDSELAEREVRYQDKRDARRRLATRGRDKEEIKNRLRALGYI